MKVTEAVEEDASTFLRFLSDAIFVISLNDEPSLIRSVSQKIAPIILQRACLLIFLQAHKFVAPKK